VTSYDPTDLQSQEVAHAEKSARNKLEQQTEESDIRWLMSSKRGRRIVWRLLVQSGLFQSTFTANAMAMAFAEGKRFFGGTMLQTIHALCPELYPVMVKEQKHDRHADDADSPTNDN
jgi:hypothetical protein